MVSNCFSLFSNCVSWFVSLFALFFQRTGFQRTGNSLIFIVGHHQWISTDFHQWIHWWSINEYQWWMSINEFIDGAHQWISMDFQFFEIQFFEKTMKKQWKTMRNHKKTIKKQWQTMKNRVGRGIFRLGFFVWDLSFRTFRVGPCAWNPSLVVLSLGLFRGIFGDL